jgi:hypothetical protein
MNRDQLIAELINKYKAEQVKNYNLYAKKLSGMISALLQQEYDLVILGKKSKQDNVRQKVEDESRKSKTKK